MTLVLYGIRNCDTVKKARAWLTKAGVAHAFHDFKTEGADPALVDGWVTKLGWETVLNRAGTTFRALSDADKAGIDAAKAIALMVAQPSMIKRPVLEGTHGDRPVLISGFKPQGYAAVFGERI
jgi:arsenate reductase